MTRILFRALRVVDNDQALGILQRNKVASALNPGIDLLSWFALAPSKVPVVVEQDCQASTGKRLRVLSATMYTLADVP